MGGIGRQPTALPQHCCSALKWALAPRIYCDLLVLTNHIRIADKAVALYSPGLPAATLPQRGGPGRLGPSRVAVMGCSDIFLQPVFCGRFVQPASLSCFLAEAYQAVYKGSGRFTRGLIRSTATALLFCTAPQNYAYRAPRSTPTFFADAAPPRQGTRRNSDQPYQALTHIDPPLWSLRACT